MRWPISSDVPSHRFKAVRTSHALSLFQWQSERRASGRANWRMQEHRPSRVSLMLVVVEVVVTAVMVVVVDASACALAVRQVCMHNKAV